MHYLGEQGFRLVIATLVVGMSTSSAWAYLDPGTGSMILQVLLGGVAGLLLAGKLYWHKVLSVLGIRRGDDVAEASTVHRDVDADAPARK